MNSTQSSHNPVKYFIFLFVALFIFLLGWNVGAKQYEHKISSPPQELQDKQEVLAKEKMVQENQEPLSLDVFWEALTILKAKHVDPEIFDNKKLLHGAIRGMVASLDDPYTAFMSPVENKDFQEVLQGELQGIGAELTLKEGLLMVVSPLKDSPAARAGIRPEDVIVKIEGEDALGLSLEEAVLKIRGEKGTDVTLTVVHKDREDQEDIVITRDVITIESVSSEMLEENIAYISINQFGENTTAEFDRALSDMILQNPKSMILDLRFNGGGYLDGAIDIVSRFMEDKSVVIIKQRGVNESLVHFTKGTPVFPDIPMVVLINKGSASASEIVAGAMQDQERAHIIGEQSFGKGTVQELVPLSDGSSIRVTIAEWFTPDEHSITQKGITPDQIVERVLEDFQADRDPQLDAAKEYLLGEGV